MDGGKPDREFPFLWINRIQEIKRNSYINKPCISCETLLLSLQSSSYYQTFNILSKISHQITNLLYSRSKLSLKLPLNTIRFNAFNVVPFVGFHMNLQSLLDQSLLFCFLIYQMMELLGNQMLFPYHSCCRFILWIIDGPNVNVIYSYYDVANGGGIGGSDVGFVVASNSLKLYNHLNL